MVKAELVEKDIEAGRLLIHALESAQVRVSFAMWLYDPGHGMWKLLIATPLFDELGPREVYRKAQRAIGSEGIDLDLSDVVALSPGDFTVKILARYFRSVRRNGDVRLTQARLNDLYVDDAHIYRV